jgi:hypothetical protein
MRGRALIPCARARAHARGGTLLIAAARYKPENVYSTGPYPLNMLGVLERSPNLHLSDAIKSSLANQDLMNYDFDRVNAEVPPQYPHSTPRVPQYCSTPQT